MRYFTVAGVLLLSCQVASADNFSSYFVLKNEGGVVIAVRTAIAGDPNTCLDELARFSKKITNGVVWSNKDYMMISSEPTPGLIDVKNFLVGLRCEGEGGSMPSNEVKKN
jgi:hypothetical protein